MSKEIEEAYNRGVKDGGAQMVERCAEIVRQWAESTCEKWAQEQLRTIEDFIRGLTPNPNHQDTLKKMKREMRKEILESMPCGCPPKDIPSVAIGHDFDGQPIPVSEFKTATVEIGGPCWRCRALLADGEEG